MKVRAWALRGGASERSSIDVPTMGLEGLRSAVADEEAKAPDAKASETGRMIEVNRRMGQDSIRMA
ncbi:MAG: hypothetical protein P8P71_05430, partial [Phycisphaerales bacterium]|nr:hypothetical protein [Phycisphaerales bacterium]